MSFKIIQDKRKITTLLNLCDGLYFVTIEEDEEDEDDVIAFYLKPTAEIRMDLLKRKDKRVGYCCCIGFTYSGRIVSKYLSPHIKIIPIDVTINISNQ